MSYNWFLQSPEVIVFTCCLDLRLTGHSTRSTQSRQADSKTSADNTETVTDNSHDSSFVVRVLFHAG